MAEEPMFPACEDLEAIVCYQIKGGVWFKCTLPETVAEAAEIEMARQHAGVIGECENLAAAVEKTRAENIEQRIEQEQPEEREGQHRDRQRKGIAAGDDHARNTVMRRGS